MKKVLVIGAAGSIGTYVIKYLLSEGKYEVTALDLNNKKTTKKLKHYKKRINIIIGDATDSVLIDSLIKDHDYVINLATSMPPLSDYHSSLTNIIEYKPTENIVRAINYFNPKCFLIYPSSTSVYGPVEEASVKTRINKDELTPFSLSKLEVESLIKKNLNNYCILRMPLILNYIKKEPFMFHVKKDNIIECVTNYDAAYACVKAISKAKELNKKTYNVGGGEKFRLEYNLLLKNILKYYGITIKYVLSRIFIEKNYFSPVLKDSDELNYIINYRNDSIQSYYMRLKRRSKKRGFQKLIAKPIVYLKNKK